MREDPCINDCGHLVPELKDSQKKPLAKNGGISVEGFDCESGVSLDKVPQLVVASCFETKHGITRAFSEGQLLQRSSHSHDGRTT